eukprot:c625_g1_i1.p1 GENE.c625_g1_i1~~c625_g1_i1.p1  ORF type:complete len:425 (+),score=83.12 c625_g1_i1:31-1275(+)
MANARAAIARSAVLGALVGDAASLGTHWLYGPNPITGRLGEGVDPLFIAPSQANYTGPCYFAHGARASGQGTMYGEAIVVGLKALQAVAANGTALRVAHRDAMWRSFGFGGSYVGYVDTATTETLVRLAELKLPRFAALVAAPEGWGGAAAVHAALLAALKKVPNAEDATALLNSAAQQLADARDPIAREYLAACAHTFVARSLAPAGSTTDVQSNALARLIPLTAKASADAAVDDEAFVRQAIDAVRETQNNDESASYIVAMHVVLRRAIQGAAVPDAVAAVVSGADPALAFLPDAESALARMREGADAAAAVTDSAAAALQFGQACNLRMTAPLIVHTLLQRGDYTNTVLRCVLGGGDNAARAAFAGAVVAAATAAAGGAAAAVPEALLARYMAHPENARVGGLLDAVFGPA